MSIRKKFYPKRPSAPTFRKNEEIRAKELRVIGEEGENFGLIPLSEALAIAKEKGLDLIEIAPQAVPPIGKLGNFDKFRYQKDKEFKKQQQNQAKDMKKVQVGVKSARNDLLLRAKRVDEFLAEGYKVEILLKLRGREKANKEWAKGKLEEFLALISENFKTMDVPKYSGSGFSVQVDKIDKKNA